MELRLGLIVLMWALCISRGLGCGGLEVGNVLVVNVECSRGSFD